MIMDSANVLSVVMPVYNEEKTIETIVNNVHALSIFDRSISILRFNTPTNCSTEAVV